MTPMEVGLVRRDLCRELRLFDDCFARSEGRRHLLCYVGGQLSALQRKCVEPMADEAGVPPRTLQDFLALHTWDHERAVDRLQQLVGEEHADEQSIGLIPARSNTSSPTRPPACRSSASSTSPSAAGTSSAASRTRKASSVWTSSSAAVIPPCNAI